MSTALMHGVRRKASESQTQGDCSHHGRRTVVVTSVKNELSRSEWGRCTVHYCVCLARSHEVFPVWLVVDVDMSIHNDWACTL